MIEKVTKKENPSRIKQTFFLVKIFVLFPLTFSDLLVANKTKQKRKTHFLLYNCLEKGNARIFQDKASKLSHKNQLRK